LPIAEHGNVGNGWRRWIRFTGGDRVEGAASNHEIRQPSLDAMGFHAMANSFWPEA